MKLHPTLVLAAALATLSISGVLAHAQNAPQPPAETSKGERGPNVPAFWVREGYRVDLAAENFGEARFLETDGKGTLFIAQMNSGKIVALSATSDGKYENPKTLVTGHPKLHGLQFFDGLLYFTTPTEIFSIDPAKPDSVKTVAKFNIERPTDGHFFRSILVTPDSIYTSIGDPGNITDVGDSPREKIWKLPFDPKTGVAGDPQLFVTGIRNTEKLRFRPGTTEIWGCDHGSDNFGARYGENGGGPVTDLNPGCEFNHYIQGFDYGHPFVVGIGIPRPEFKDRPDILQKVNNATPPAWMFGGHWAPNGWTFLSTDKLTGSVGDAVIALHGSWNRRAKAGYRIERLAFDSATGRPWGGQTLVGTLNDAGTDVLARPVDCLELADGSVLFSDDSKNRVFRLTRIAK